jgi:hypothetical protein
VNSLYKATRSSALIIAAFGSLAGCATLTEDAMTPVALTFSDGSNGKCNLSNKRGVWQTSIPTTIPIRKSDDGLKYDCETTDKRKALGLIPSTMGGKIIASAVFIDFGITDAITDKHREYPPSFVIPMEKVETAAPASAPAATPATTATPGA